MKIRFAGVVWAVIFLISVYGTVHGQDGEYLTAPDDIPQWELSGEFENYLFISNFSFAASNCPVGAYVLIIDGSGELVWYKPVKECAYATELRPYPDGTLVYAEVKGEGWHVLDKTYTEIEKFSTFEGESVDVHDFIKTDDGHVLVMYENFIPLDPNGTVPPKIGDLVIREFDENRNVIFKWRALDHFTLDESDDRHQQPDGAGLIDAIHANAMEIDNDGGLLLSSRHMNEITKIDRTTGEIIWRLGGKKNQFTLLGDTRWFSHQHDIRRLPNGDLTLFDNGNFMSPEYSRVVEYKMDLNTMTIARVRQFRSAPDIFSQAMGSARLQSDGSLLVGWGANSRPAVTEFTPNGGIAFQLSLPDGEFTYRAHLGDWHGYPIEPPVMMLDGSTLHFSWNGSTETVEYRILVDGTAFYTAQKTGFETTFVLPEEQASGGQNCSYQVVPVDGDGNNGILSNAVEAPCAITTLYVPFVSGA